MNTILLANHAAILPAIDYFHSQVWLQAVISTDKLHSENLVIEDICRQRHIPFYKITRGELKTTVSDLFDQLKPDLVFMCGFTYRVPLQLIRIPALGFFNIHFSLLPAYRGPDPIFWQLKHGEETGGITIHKVEEDFDSGEVVARQGIQFIEGENWGICNIRYGAFVFNMMIPIINKLNRSEEIVALNHIPIHESYYPRPLAENLIIHWETQTANEVENLVNASNPLYGGALTFYKGQTIRLLEVSPVQMQGEIPSVKPGTIIFSDAQNGLVVLCADKNILKINVAKINEGYFSGFKLFAMGVKTGDQFQTAINQQTIINN